MELQRYIINYTESCWYPLGWWNWVTFQGLRCRDLFERAVIQDFIGGRRLPTRLCFIKFVCQNKRIGDPLGDAHWVNPLDPPPEGPTNLTCHLFLRWHGRCFTCQVHDNKLHLLKLIWIQTLHFDDLIVAISVVEGVASFREVIQDVALI